MNEDIQNLFYLLASVCFIISLKMLSHPKTALRGNMLGASGMLLAVLVTLLNKEILSFDTIIAALVLGSLIGWAMARFSPVTSVPQLVAAFNGLGGGASALAVGAVLEEVIVTGEGLHMANLFASVLSGSIGALTFFGSAVAFVRLEGWVSERAFLIPGRHLVSLLLAIASLVAGIFLLMNPGQLFYYWLLLGFSSLLGFTLVVAIGGGDMPVVISLLNSYSGVAAAAYGWVIQNMVLIIAGAIVGAAGLILTQLMSKAMNRSLLNIIFGGVSAESGSGHSQVVREIPVKETTAEEVAILMDGAQLVVVVPGYGMALAQAQHAVKELCKILESRGTKVLFGIHPVAGRMPGHMNALLAEANVSYDHLKDLEEINATFREADLVLVVGANDIVNTSARELSSSNPLQGMPILNVDNAKSTVVLKRSLSPGFAGIDNPLFYSENTLMLFGDSKKMILEINTALNE